MNMMIYLNREWINKNGTVKYATTKKKKWINVLKAHTSYIDSYKINKIEESHGYI